MDRTLYFEAFFVHESNKNLDAIHTFDRAEAKPAQVQGKKSSEPPNVRLWQRFLDVFQQSVWCWLWSLFHWGVQREPLSRKNDLHISLVSIWREGQFNISRSHSWRFAMSRPSSSPNSQSIAWSFTCYELSSSSPQRRSMGNKPENSGLTDKNREEKHF